MSDYYSMNSSPVDNIGFPSYTANDRDDDQISLAAAAVVPMRRYNNIICGPPAVQSQSRYINQNNQTSLTWHISLTDDQDDVSERFLRMHLDNKPKEDMGPSILTVSKNIKKQTDGIFKSTAEMNPNKIFDYVSTKVSWSLPASYQQYLNSIPSNVLEKKERHVPHSWTQWNRSAGTLYRPWPSHVVASPVPTDRSLQSSPSPAPSTLYANGTCGTSPKSSTNNGYNNKHGNPFGNGAVGMAAVQAMAAGTPCARDPIWASASASPKQRFNGSDQQQRSAQVPVSRVRSPSAFGLSGASANSYDGSKKDRPSASPISPSTCAAVAVGSGAPGVRGPSRLYYCTNSETNTINKLVEHYCTFCFKNAEPPEVFGSHLVRDSIRTTCPMLRALRCKHCNGTGDNAHTIKYCPFFYANYG